MQNKLSDLEKIEEAFKNNICILCASKERARELEIKGELNDICIEAISIRSLVYDHEHYSDHRNAQFVIDDVEGILSALGIYEVNK